MAWRTSAVGCLMLGAALVGCSLDWPAPITTSANGGANAGGHGAGGFATGPSTGGGGTGGGGYVDPQCAMCPALAVADGGGTIVSVGPQQDLQSALNNAAPGDVIALTPGADYIGNFTLPANTGAPIRLQMADVDNVLQPCERLSLSAVDSLPKLIGTNGATALFVEGGGWHVVGVALRTAGGGNVGDAVVKIGTRQQTDETQLPSGVVLDRVAISGDPTLGTYHGIRINGSDITVMNSRIQNLWTPNTTARSHAVIINNAPSDIRVLNNYLESSSALVGLGTATSGVLNLVPTNIVIRNNSGGRPASWNGLVSDNGDIHGFVLAQNAANLTIDANTFDNAPANGAIQLNPNTQNGAPAWARVQGVTISSNVLTNVVGTSVLRIHTGNSTAGATDDVVLSNNLVYGDHAGNVSSSITLDIRFTNGVTMGPLQLLHNTLLQPGDFTGGISGQHADLVVTNNVLNLGEDGFDCGVDEGQDCLNAAFAMWLYDYNLATTPDKGSYPAMDNIFVASDLGFVDAGNDDYEQAATSPGFASASDGKDRGVDFSAMDEAHACQTAE